MSVNFSVYLGPFIRVPAVQQDKVSKTFVCSKSCGAKPAKGARFCAQCGAAVELLERSDKVAARASCMALSDELSDKVFSPEGIKGSTELEAVWMPNQMGWGQHFSDYSPVSAAVSLQGLDVSKQLALFASAHADVLQAIRDIWGVEARVDYGIVAYTH